MWCTQQHVKWQWHKKEKSIPVSKLPRTTAENKVRAGIVGIETIIKTINTHINNIDVCRQGCGALWVMVTYNRNTSIVHIK